jgi:hypothetical protein
MLLPLRQMPLKLRQKLYLLPLEPLRQMPLKLRQKLYLRLKPLQQELPKLLAA